MHTTWNDVRTSAPEFADSVTARFAANLHHVLGTVRADGSPRLSGTEVPIDAEVRLGMMGGSRKLGDVRRDPRVEIHSAPLEEDLATGDAKISGRAIPQGPVPDVPDGHAFVIDVERVSLVRVDGDELEISVWRPGSGLSVIRRR